jgi:hypothetical protein
MDAKQRQVDFEMDLRGLMIKHGAMFAKEEFTEKYSNGTETLVLNTKTLLSVVLFEVADKDYGTVKEFAKFPLNTKNY